jgi:hypothetical protein
MTNKILIVWLVALLFSCGQKKHMTAEEYMVYMESGKSDLKISRELNNVSYNVQMLTPEHQVLLNTPELISKPDAFKEELRYYRNKLNFIVVLSDPASGNNKVKSTVFDKGAYGKILAYANTSLKEDFYLIQDQDTLFSTITHLESANSIQPVFRIALGFNEVDTLTKEFTLVFNDRIFNSGPVKFHYSKDLLSNLPEIKM